MLIMNRLPTACGLLILGLGASQTSGQTEAPSARIQISASGSTCNRSRADSKLSGASSSGAAAGPRTDCTWKFPGFAFQEWSRVRSQGAAWTYCGGPRGTTSGATGTMGARLLGVGSRAE